MGNENFKHKKYQEAIDGYSRSISFLLTAVVYANRAMAFKAQELAVMEWLGCLSLMTFQVKVSNFLESTYLLEVQQLHLVMLCLPTSLPARHLLVPPCTCMEKRSPNLRLILSSRLSFLYLKLSGSNIKFMIKEL